MVLGTDIDYWEGKLKDETKALQVTQECLVRLEQALKRIGTPLESMELDITGPLYSNLVIIKVTVELSVLAAAQIISDAFYLTKPELKMRYIGNPNSTECQRPQNEWFIVTNSVSDEPRVNVKYVSTATSAGPARFDITLLAMPVPGYLMSAKETPAAVRARLVAEQAAKDESDRLAKNRRARERRAANKVKKIEQPLPEGVPMLLGPKGLSLCVDAPKDIETPQLTEVANVSTL